MKRWWADVQPKQCEHCQDQFWAGRKDRRFCTPRCRLAAFRKRAAETGLKPFHANRGGK